MMRRTVEAGLNTSQRNTVAAELIRKYIPEGTSVELRSSLGALAKEWNLEQRDVEAMLGIRYDDQTGRARLSPPELVGAAHQGTNAPGVFENPRVLGALVEGFRAAGNDPQKQYAVMRDACLYVGIEAPSEEEYTTAARALQNQDADAIKETTHHQGPAGAPRVTKNWFQRVAEKSPLLLTLLALNTGCAMNMKFKINLNTGKPKVEIKMTSDDNTYANPNYESGEWVWIEDKHGGHREWRDGKRKWVLNPPVPEGAVTNIIIKPANPKPVSGKDLEDDSKDED